MTCKELDALRLRTNNSPASVEEHLRNCETCRRIEKLLSTSAEGPEPPTELVASITDSVLAQLRPVSPLPSEAAAVDRAFMPGARSGRGRHIRARRRGLASHGALAGGCQLSAARRRRRRNVAARDREHGARRIASAAFNHRNSGNCRHPPGGPYRSLSIHTRPSVHVSWVEVLGTRPSDFRMCRSAFCGNPAPAAHGFLRSPRALPRDFFRVWSA